MQNIRFSEVNQHLFQNSIYLKRPLRNIEVPVSISPWQYDLVCERISFTKY